MPAGTIDARRYGEVTWQMLSWMRARTREGFGAGRECGQQIRRMMARCSPAGHRGGYGCRRMGLQAIERSMSVLGANGSDVSGRSPGAMRRRELRKLYPRRFSRFIGDAEGRANRDCNRHLRQKKAEARHQAKRAAACSLDVADIDAVVDIGLAASRNDMADFGKLERGMVRQPSVQCCGEHRLQHEAIRESAGQQPCPLTPMRILRDHDQLPTISLPRHSASARNLVPGLVSSGCKELAFLAFGNDFPEHANASQGARNGEAREDRLAGARAPPPTESP